MVSTDVTQSWAIPTSKHLEGSSLIMSGHQLIYCYRSTSITGRLILSGALQVGTREFSCESLCRLQNLRTSASSELLHFSTDNTLCQSVYPHSCAVQLLNIQKLVMLDSRNYSWSFDHMLPTILQEQNLVLLAKPFCFSSIYISNGLTSGVWATVHVSETVVGTNRID